MTTLATHVVLALSLLALGAAGLRLASLVLPSGLLRLVGAAVLASAFAASAALLVGLVGLDMRPIPLSAAAGLTWVAARRFAASPSLRLSAEAVAWWRAASMRARIALGAGLAAVIGSMTWQLIHPALGNDTLLYHLPTAMAFVQDNDPGGVPSVLALLPVGAYPSMQELLFAWFAGLSRGLVGFSVLPVAQLVVTATAAYAGLRSLRVVRWVASLAAAAVTLPPQVIGWQFTGAVTDPGALCWVACCGALCAASLRRSPAFALALVAGGLAIGTKTSAVPVTGLMLVFTGAVLGRRTISAPRALAAGTALASLVGLFWYVRNLVRFGSPLWPFYSAPWGDPKPPGLAGAQSFSEHPRLNLQWLSHQHFSHFGGPLVLLAGGVLAPLVSREREVLAASLATLVTVALWTKAPVTGVNTDATGFVRAPASALSTVRYLLPALTVAAAALALASRRNARAATLVILVLFGSLLLDVIQAETELSQPAVVPFHVLGISALAGGVVAAGATVVGFAPHPSRTLAVVATATLVLGTAGGLAVAAPGYSKRNARLGGWQSDLVRWLASQPTYAHGDRPVAGVALRPGILVGSRLQHRVSYVSERTACPDFRKRTRGAWVIVFALSRGPGQRSPAERCLGARRPAFSNPPFRIYRPA